VTRLCFFSPLPEFGEFGKNFIEIGKRPEVREAMLRLAVKADGIRSLLSDAQ
jgi:hypothetical protein